MLGHRAARRHYQAVENVRSCAFSTSQVRRMSVLARANQALARPIRGSAIHGRSWQAVFNGLLWRGLRFPSKMMICADDAQVGTPAFVRTLRWRAMNQNPTPTPTKDDHEPLRVPSRTTPTWEVELLISGAVVFSLFSLRDPLDGVLARWLPQLSADMGQALMFGVLYGKVVLYTLIIAFVLHIAARAQWVALVGVYSVYPKGPRWENISGGPITRDYSRERYSDIAAAIERADNRSSLIFGYGILCAQFALGILLVSLLAVPVLAAIRAFGGEHETLLLVLFMAVIAAPPMLVVASDKWLVPRLGREHRISRLTERVARATFGVSQGMMQPLMALITTNVGGRRGPWLPVLALYAVIGLVAFDIVGRSSDYAMLRGEGLSKLERDAGVHPSHYASLRGEAWRHRLEPYIESEIVHGPYLKVTLPYSPSNHDASLAEHCPMQAVAEEGEAAARRNAQRQADAARVQCFGERFALALDGAPLADLRFERTRDASNGLDAAMTMIDLRDLPVGRHELTAMKWGSKSAEETSPHRIPFWR